MKRSPCPSGAPPWFRPLLKSFLAPPNLLHVGWGPPALIVALLLTMLTYFCLNTYLTGRIDSAYSATTLPELSEVTSAQAAESVLDFSQVNQKLRSSLRPWLREALVPKRPAHKQLEDLFGTVSGGSDSTDEGRSQLLRNLIVGQRQHWRVFWLSSPDRATGEDVVKAVEKLEGGNWGKTLHAQDDSKAKRAVLVRFSDRLITQMDEPNRTLNLFTGWVQWVTIYLFWLILVTLARRGVALWRLNREVEGRSPSAAWIDMLTDDRYRGKPWPGETAWYRDGFSRLRTALENDVYGTFAYLLGLLPSAGFIGTVQGIGSALMAASGLFSQRDRERTIGEITRHLGFAFDATFIALLLGAVGGALAVIYRLIEQNRLRKWEAQLLKQHADIEAPWSAPPSPREQATTPSTVDGRSSQSL